ncbi:sulfate adenylyltransferase subunit 1 [Betaproteobacteria bacterium]|nr:sulfate adenylyltransferase subunit 1 [Betaproteobacteria bacterium]GHU00841.1 sulfate adenylyltransferase subunit 1 [Betaproteobacteria bacterium]GHU15869.1 sulfate adenylyltransferase subunit 1 [Betaproteobacteria bacterium]
MSATTTPTSTTPEVEDHGLLRFLTCGSVDDGKSTLIGRLLYDSKTILADTLSSIQKTSQKRGLESVDLSLLTDGLQAEREQGITIDVAYRYFSTGTRKYIIADAPGHEQYTRNMVTAASTANLAIILVDARRGVLTQTRRHSILAHLVGIPHLVVAINKMDLVDYSQEIFTRIMDDFLEFAAKRGIEDVHFIPLSALTGDMVVERGESLDWYQGPTLIEILEDAPLAHSEHTETFRFPVQYVCRPQDSANPALHDYRGFMGQVESGSIRTGDVVTVLPSGLSSTVKAVQLGGEEIGAAFTEQSVTLLLQDEIDVSRGDMIVQQDAAPQARKEIEAIICWFSEVPLDRARTFLIRHTSREVKARLTAITHKLDVNTLERLPAEKLQMNDIARVHFKLAQPVFADPYAANRSTGAFIVIDESNNNTVGAGMIQ